MEGKSLNSIGQRANRERRTERVRDFPQHQIWQCWGTEFKIFKVEETSYAKTHFFFPQKHNANPISILLCVHSSKVTYNIHSKFEHTAKAAVKTWWTWDEKNHTDEQSAAASAPHWRETVHTGAGLHSCSSCRWPWLTVVVPMGCSVT